MAFYETKHSALGFQTSFYRHHQNLSFHAHLHAGFELLRVKEGVLRVLVEGTEYVLTAGQQILILPNLIHSYRTDGEGSLCQFVIFSPDFLPELYEQAKNGSYRSPLLESESFALFDLLLQHRKDHFLFRSALYRIAAAYEKNEPLPMAEGRNGEFALWLSDYLEQHCAERLDERSVARAAGYHPRYLSSLINRNFGVSFQTLLSEYRIRLAVTLLADPRESITEVYGRAGFESQSSFNRNFKRIMGVTPREYRKVNDKWRPTK